MLKLKLCMDLLASRAAWVSLACQESPAASAALDPRAPPDPPACPARREREASRAWLAVRESLVWTVNLAGLEPVVTLALATLVCLASVVNLAALASLVCLDLRVLRASLVRLALAVLVRRETLASLVCLVVKATRVNLVCLD